MTLDYYLLVINIFLVRIVIVELANEALALGAPDKLQQM